jgi:hypothetical protein
MLWAMVAMAAASVAYEDCLLLYHMSTLAMGDAWVDRMLVI